MFGSGHYPVIGGCQPGHDFQQGGFSCTVDPHQADSVATVDLDRYILEQMLFAVANI